jgi:hypothetical protein
MDPGTPSHGTAPASPLTLVIRAYVHQSCPTISESDTAQMDEVIAKRIAGDLDDSSAMKLSTQLIGTSLPIERLNAILNVSDRPLSPISSHSSGPRVSNIRKKNKSWSEHEDTRLLAGVHKFGLEAWGSIARFVGNNRVKTQCCQRWSRGLDPRLKRSAWTSEEDEKLLQLVQRFDNKSWTRIAMEFPDRCDVQCRYRFHQLCHGVAKVESETEEPSPKMRLPSIHSLIAQGESRLSNQTTPSDVMCPIVSLSESCES